MLDSIVTNLMNTGWAMLIFVCSYVANMLFSLYYNIEILKQAFDKTKLIKSVIKIFCIVLGTACVVTSITCLPTFANKIGWAIPKEYVDVFSSLTILGSCLVVSCKYIFEAVQKFSKVLNNKSEEILNDTTRN